LRRPSPIEEPFVKKTLILLVAIAAFAAPLRAEEPEQKKKTGIRTLLSEPRMELPPELTSSASESIEGASVRTWRRPFRFGPFEVRNLKKGNLPSSERGLTIGYVSAGNARARQRYTFELMEEDRSAALVACSWLAGSRGLTHRRGDSTTDLRLREMSAVRCTIDTDELWTLQLETTLAPRLNAPDVESTGSLSNGSRTFDVIATHRIEGIRILAGEPTGYLFSLDGAPVAAMERTSRGRLVLVPGLDPDDRTLLAAAGAALFFQEQLSEVIDP
jgi:hypothetical protein